MDVRRAAPSDGPRLTGIFAASVEALASGHYAREQVEAWRDAWRPLPPEALARAWVAEEAGRVVGFARLKDGEVDLLYVHPDAAGRGVGTLLLAQVEREARALGLASLKLHASLNAEDFYAKRGWRALRRETVETQPGVHLARVEMGKTL